MGSIGGDLVIFNNDSLRTLNGFEPTDVDGSLQIHENALVAQCEVDALDDALTASCAACSGNDDGGFCDCEVVVNAFCRRVEPPDGALPHCLGVGRGSTESCGLWVT